MYRLLRSSLAVLTLLTAVSVAQAPHRQQKPLSNMGGAAPQASSVTLSDVLPRSQSIGIFSSFCNDVPAVSTLLTSNAENLTILAPLDAAVKAMPHKPWEDPRQYAQLGTQAYDGEDGGKRAQENLRRFVEAHIVQLSPWAEGQKAGRLSGEGGEVWWESKDGKQLIQPGNIEVVKVADKVSNGEVWVISGVMNYAV